MEQVLEVYQQPYDPRYPVVCRDDQPKQTDRGVAALAADQPRRIGNEYFRQRVCNVWMFTEPPAGWLEVSVRKTKTKVDGAVEMVRLLEGRYANCE